MLDTIVPMANKIKDEIETETGVNIYAIIQMIGKPVISVGWKCERRKKFLESKDAFNAHSQSELDNIKILFEMRCNAIGLIPVAKLTEDGGQIFYRLTEDKIKES